MQISNKDTDQIVLPSDDNSNQMQIVPAKAPLHVTNSSSLSSQVEVTLQVATSVLPKTTFIEVSAINTPIFMKYKTAAGGTAVSSTVFDEMIQAGSTRHYAIPYILSGGVYTQATVLAFIEQAASATLILIEK